MVSPGTSPVCVTLPSGERYVNVPSPAFQRLTPPSLSQFHELPLSASNSARLPSAPTLCVLPPPFCTDFGPGPRTMVLNGWRKVAEGFAINVPCGSGCHSFSFAAIHLSCCRTGRLLVSGMARPSAPSLTVIGQRIGSSAICNDAVAGTTAGVETGATGAFLLHPDAATARSEREMTIGR